MDTVRLKPGYELVFTVADYYDGPRKGIANYQGKPHLYECIFDEAADNYSEFFLLTPLDSESFKLAMEDWEIWRHWEDAFHSGKVDKSTHPALPHEARRHAELKQILDKSLLTDPQKAVKRIGHFDVLGKSSLPKGVLPTLQVKWNEPSPDIDTGERRPNLRGYR